MSAVAILGDDPIATRAVGLGLARGQAMHRRVFLADLLGDDVERLPDDGVGVSDMVRYGISLGRASQPSKDSPNLFHLAGGTESPLAEDVLGSDRWRSLSAQIHDAGGLLLLTAPSRVPNLSALLAQLDGVVVVGDATPETPVPVLGSVQTAGTMRTPSMPSRAIPPHQESPRSRWPWAALTVAAIAALLLVPQIREPVFQTMGLAKRDAPELTIDSSLGPLAPSPSRVTSDAAWSTELRFLNSLVDAQAAVLALVDSFPAATFAEVRTNIDSTTWYRVMLGAFSDSISAENFLAGLRATGTVPASAGTVTHVPYALLVDSTTDHGMARLRVSGYQGRGLPAYSLRDSAGVWHVYVGAFPEGADADPVRRQLDSLNIQSVLVVRTGSTS